MPNPYFPPLSPSNIRRNTLNLYSQVSLRNSVLFGVSSCLPYSSLVNKFQLQHCLCYLNMCDYRRSWKLYYMLCKWEVSVRTSIKWKQMNSSLYQTLLYKKNNIILSNIMRNKLYELTLWIDYRCFYSEGKTIPINTTLHSISNKLFGHP